MVPYEVQAKMHRATATVPLSHYPIIPLLSHDDDSQDEARKWPNGLFGFFEILLAEYLIRKQLESTVSFWYNLDL